YEDFAGDPAAVLRDIPRFLGVDDRFIFDTRRRHLEGRPPRNRLVGHLKRLGVANAAAKWTPSNVRPLLGNLLTKRRGAISLEAADRRWLQQYYRDDVRRLEDLIHRDLQSWLVRS